MNTPPSTRLHTACGKHPWIGWSAAVLLGLAGLNAQAIQSPGTAAPHTRAAIAAQRQSAPEQPLDKAVVMGMPLAQTDADPSARWLSAGAWAGRLEVIAHQGQGCARQPDLPYLRQLNVGAQRDAAGQWRLFLTGDTQALVATGPMASMVLRKATGEAGPAGVLQLQAQGGGWQGRWAEPAPAAADRHACAWTEARLMLDPAPRLRGGVDASTPSTSDRTARVFELAARAQSTWSRQPHQAVADLAQASSLADQLASEGVADLALSRQVLELSDQARLLRRLDLALPLARTAVALHRSIEARHPEEAADALARLGDVLRRMRRPEEAMQFYEDALGLLDRPIDAGSAMAAAILNSLGTLQLSQQRLPEAAAAFESASERDARGQRPMERAASLNNLAQTLALQGRQDRALALYDEALRLLDAHNPTHQSLLAVVRNNRSSLSRAAADLNI